MVGHYYMNVPKDNGCNKKNNTKMISHKKKYGVYHWDTFDNETWLQFEDDSFQNCLDWVKEYYVDRIRDSGADKVDIVDNEGDVKKSFRIG